MLAKHFCGLGDPTRLRILALLRDGEKSVGELVEALDQHQPKISNHLACLRWCRFVRPERRGMQVFYSVADKQVSKVIDLTRGLLTYGVDY